MMWDPDSLQAEKATQILWELLDILFLLKLAQIHLEEGRTEHYTWCRVFFFFFFAFDTYFTWLTEFMAWDDIYWKNLCQMQSQ